jgi:hypothetical protein
MMQQDLTTTGNKKERFYDVYNTAWHVQYLHSPLALSRLCPCVSMFMEHV